MSFASIMSSLILIPPKFYFSHQTLEKHLKQQENCSFAFSIFPKSIEYGSKNNSSDQVFAQL